MEQVRQLLDAVIEGIEEKKGEGIVVVDLSNIEGAICRNFIICQGNSPTQVEAIAESVGETVRKKLGEKPAGVAGLEQALWVAIDFTDVMVHIFVPELRQFYDLEHLWEDAEVERLEDHSGVVSETSFK